MRSSSEQVSCLCSVALVRQAAGLGKLHVQLITFVSYKQAVGGDV